MGKKKKPPSPKVHNTRSTTKVEAAVIKEQVTSWWDKLVSGNTVDSEVVERKDERKSEEPKVCGLNQSVSTVPSVSTVEVSAVPSVSTVEVSAGKDESSKFVSSENVVSLDGESSGSSYTVAGDESVNSSLVVMKFPEVKSSKMASLYDILDYNKKNITIPAKFEVSGSLTPVKGPLTGKSEYEIWMMRRDASVMAAKNSGVENSSGNNKGALPVNKLTPKNMRNDGICDDDVSREHSLAAAEEVLSDNPNYSQPSDAIGRGTCQRMG
ncbi:hypothetical protein Hanom_Chr02g00158491 [Helianthus anomalus]